VKPPLDGQKIGCATTAFDYDCNLVALTRGCCNSGNSQPEARTLAPAATTSSAAPTMTPPTGAPDGPQVSRSRRNSAATAEARSEDAFAQA